MKLPKDSVWTETRNAFMTSSDIGIVVINWKDAHDDRIKEIISELYNKNRDVISGMNYAEYKREETEELVKKIPAFLEGKYEEKKEKVKQTTLFAE